MELKNLDGSLSLLPKYERPLRVMLAGSDGENMIRGLFQAQKEGFVQPVLVGDRARTIALLEKLGLEREPYTMVDVGSEVDSKAISDIKTIPGVIRVRVI